MRPVIGLLLPLTSFCQTFAQDNFYRIDTSTGRYTITEVISVDSISKEDLFARANYSLADLFKSAQNVTQVKDDQNFQIMAKGVVPVKVNHLGFRRGGYIRFMLILQCRDNRYKYTITDFTHEASIDFPYACGNLENEKPDLKIGPKLWTQIKEDFKNQMIAFVSNLKVLMNAKKSSNDEDW